jgi:hypothetical protein
MSISNISFWQQDQNWQNQQQVWAQQLSNNNAFFSIMQGALTNQTTGLASIANQRALNRVNSQIAALLSGGASSSTSSTSKNSVPAARPQPDIVPLQSSSANSQTGATAASLLAGEIPIGSILSVLA